MPAQEPFSIYCKQLGPMENFVYLIHDHASKRAAIVDPAWEVEQLIDLAAQQDIEITDILLTHSHHDHINGIDRVLRRYDAELHLIKQEAKFWGEHLKEEANLWGTHLTQPRTHHGGDKLKLGNTEIEILHTPGHTPGSACYKLGNNLIAGDTLFVFGCGRCDLRGGNPEIMYDTLRKLKNDLPDNMILHPGHNYSPAYPTSTIAAQTEGNPFMHFDNKDDFVKYRMKIHDKVRSDPYEPVSQQEAHQCLHKHR